jgi:hypothetical protein
MLDFLQPYLNFNYPMTFMCEFHAWYNVFLNIVFVYVLFWQCVFQRFLAYWLFLSELYIVVYFIHSFQHYSYVLFIGSFVIVFVTSIDDNWNYNLCLATTLVFVVMENINVEDLKQETLGLVLLIEEFHSHYTFL